LEVEAGHPKKRHEHTLPTGRVLIEEDADHPPAAEGLHDLAHRPVLDDQLGTAAAPEAAARSSRSGSSSGRITKDSGSPVRPWAAARSSQLP
jgi:hypothetical protein